MDVVVVVVVAVVFGVVDAIKKKKLSNIINLLPLHFEDFKTSKGVNINIE